MPTQVTLLTSHKGVDLHAATATRVIRDRLEGGGRLVALGRAEFHTWWEAQDGPPAPSVSALLATGRYFNPNKHRYGHFRLRPAGEPWTARGPECRGGPLPGGWPGEAVATDLGGVDAGLFDRLLGGAAPAGAEAVDVCAFPLDGVGRVLSGVVWRLVLSRGGTAAAELAEALAVTRSARRGLLVNPHMEGWLTAARGGAPCGAAG